MLITLTLLSALPLITVGLFMYSVTRDAISEYIASQQNEIVLRARNEIDLFLETPVTLLNLLLETQDITEMDPFSQNLILNKVKSSFPYFKRIFTLDSTGTIITSTAFGERQSDLQDEVFFQYGMKGLAYFSPVQYSEVREPFVISSHPIRRLDQILGVLVGEIDLKSIWAVVDSIKIGESGNAFVITSNGQLVAHPDKRKILERATLIEHDLIEELRSSQSKTMRFFDPDGTEMIGTFLYLEYADWIIVLQQPLDEAFGVASSMLYQVLGFVGLVILIAILLAYLLERRITDPINDLVSGVKRYAEGHLNYRITTGKFEELAVLAAEFNTMAGSLLEHQKKLRRVERLAAMSKFASLVSHEIRNPLNSMNINMQILKREMERPGSDPDKLRKYYDIIISEIQRMDNLINNFLMISRPPRFDFLPNDLHEILDEVILMHEGNARQQGVEIRKEYTGIRILANVDRDQMKQVFHNIIINSLQAMPEGGQLAVRTGIGKVQNRNKQNVDAFRIEIADTGVGIPQDKLQDIFEFYYTSKKTGTGLGLAIARQIIDGHFGKIMVTSELNRGTRLIISIPLKSQAIAIKPKQPADLE